jgi:hypothetical protein
LEIAYYEVEALVWKVDAGDQKQTENVDVMRDIVIRKERWARNSWSKCDE